MFLSCNQVAGEEVLPVLSVIPAKAGIQAFLDSRLRGSDGLFGFFSNLSVATQ